MEYRKLGRFHIKRSVAKGGMGEIVRSVDDSGRQIALKTILDSYQDDVRFRKLFIREAEITFQLRHPNIIRAYRFDKLGNRLVLALEYLEGVNLKDVLCKIHDEKLQIPILIVKGIIEKVLRGLQYAHEKCDPDGTPLGIIHRDINPANIFITFDGEIKILDFGISKATQLEVHQLTPKNQLKGKVCYLSPEQISNQSIDHRADIFSLGIVLWESLTGTPLYVRETDAEVMEAIVKGEYKSVCSYRPDISPGIDYVIKKALRLDPRSRYQSCDEFNREFSEACRRQCLPGICQNEISIFVRSLFSKLSETEKEDPQFMSGYALLMAQADGHEQKGIEMAEKLARDYPTRPYIQLNYARALLLKGDRLTGLRLMRRLVRVDSLEGQVQHILEWMGVRRRPVIPVLSRSHPINYVLGRLRHRLKGPTPYQEQFLSA